MVIFTVIMLIPVGVLSQLEPAGQERDNIAFMIVVPLVALLGVAGYWRMRHRARGMGILTINPDGITCGDDGRPVRLAWSELHATGMSKGRLDLFPRVPRSLGVDPWLDERLRSDPPPRPDLPPRRYVLALPNHAEVQRSIESALTRYGPDHWIGRF